MYSSSKTKKAKQTSAAHLICLHGLSLHEILERNSSWHRLRHRISAGWKLGTKRLILRKKLKMLIISPTSCPVQVTLPQCYCFLTTSKYTEIGDQEIRLGGLINLFLSYLSMIRTNFPSPWQVIPRSNSSSGATPQFSDHWCWTPISRLSIIRSWSNGESRKYLSANCQGWQEVTRSTTSQVSLGLSQLGETVPSDWWQIWTRLLRNLVFRGGCVCVLWLQFLLSCIFIVRFPLNFVIIEYLINSSPPPPPSHYYGKIMVD